jgi:hypothetical protein
MERLLSRTNVDRYRRMVANPSDDVQRRSILKSLAEEYSKLRSAVKHDDAP